MNNDGDLADIVTEALPAAFTAALAVCGDEHDASDAVGAAIERVLHAYRVGRLDLGRNPRAYLLKAVRNAAIDARRRRSAQPAPLVGVEGGGPEEFVELLEERQAITEAIQALNPRHRECLRLVDEHEGDMAAAGRAMTTPRAPGAMRMLALRARRALTTRYLEVMVGGWATAHCPAVVRALVSSAPLTTDQHVHLESCSTCAGAEDELRRHGIGRMVVVVVPAGLMSQVDSLLSSARISSTTGAQSARRSSKRSVSHTVVGSVGGIVGAVALLAAAALWSDDGGGSLANAPAQRDDLPSLDSGFDRPDEIGDGTDEDEPADPIPPLAPAPGEPDPERGDPPIEFGERAVEWTPATGDPDDGGRSDDPAHDDPVVEVVVGLPGAEPIDLRIPQIEAIPLPEVVGVEAFTDDAALDAEVLGENLVRQP